MTHQPHDRLHDLDAVRGWAMVLGVVYHSLFTLFPWAGGIGYFCSDVSAAPAAETVGQFLHGFRMELFFSVGGLFASQVIRRHGLTGFWQNRKRRILLPWVTATLVLVVTQRVLSEVAVVLGRAGPGHQPNWAVRPYYLWFLYYMLMLDLVVVGACLLLRLHPAPGRWMTRLSGSLIKQPFLLCLAILPTAAILFTRPQDPYFDFRPVWGWLGYYGVFFLFGCCLERWKEERWRLRAWVAPGLLGGTAAFAAGRWADGAGEGVRALLDAATAWLLVLGMLGAFIRWFSRERPVHRFLADASYWIYLSHWGVVTLLQILLAPVPWPWWAKAALVIAVALTTSAVTFHPLVRRTWLNRFIGSRGRSADPAPVAGRSARSQVPAA